MESIQPNPELGEKEKYQPRYMLFIGRHAEPAPKSIFDQVGGEKGTNSNNFEESSLTLKGVVESSMLNHDVLSEIFKRFPEGKIDVIFANSRAFRTEETAQIIKESLQREAAKLERAQDLVFEGPDHDDRLTEFPSESNGRSFEDIADLVDWADRASQGEQSAVFFGITHAQKMEGFLTELGMEVDDVKTSEFLTITDSGHGENKVEFRNASANLNLEEIDT